MKAIEIAKEAMFEFLEIEYPNNSFEDYYDVPEWIIKAMIKYTEIKCKEQREIVFNVLYTEKPPKGSQSAGTRLYYQYMTQKKFRETILNAPEPEFE